MASEHPTSPAVRARHERASWLDVARVLLAFASLTAAFWAATYFAVGRAFFILTVAAGFSTFVVLMLALGRDLSRRWIDFGRAVGFAPASRRPLLDLGTDRPVLHGSAGRHPARLRLVRVADGGRGEEWIQAEVELLVDAADPGVLRRAAALGARVKDARLFVRLPFFGYDADAAHEFLAYVAHTADAVEG